MACIVSIEASDLPCHISQRLVKPADQAANIVLLEEEGCSCHTIPAVGFGCSFDSSIGSAPLNKQIFPLPVLLQIHKRGLMPLNHDWKAGSWNNHNSVSATRSFSIASILSVLAYVGFKISFKWLSFFVLCCWSSVSIIWRLVRIRCFV
jgi:hypothetical protein